MGMNEHEANHPFIECATFPDDIKTKGFKGDTSAWHFDDLAFFDHFNTTIAPQNFNVTWAIGYMKDQLMMPHTPDENTVGVERDFGDSFNMRMLIHFCGDIHQPLHTGSRYSANFPNGDQGGNLFNITGKDNITELHAFWDSTAYEWD